MQKVLVKSKRRALKMPEIVFAEPEMPVIEHFKVGLSQFANIFLYSLSD